MIPRARTVSIGLPVYNGENYLAEALQSTVNQTFADFELIISDNASTDGTQDICRSFAAKDPRIRYYRNASNLGAAKNFNRVLELSSSRYFKWSAHDDLIAPSFIEKCVDVLERDPAVVLAFSKVTVIDEFGTAVKKMDFPSNKLGAHRPEQRFGTLIQNDLHCFEVFGVIRTEVLKKTPGISSYIASDRPLRADLGLMGRFSEVPEYLFFVRDHSKRSIRAFPAHHLRGAWFDPARTAGIVLPHWRIFCEYYKSVRRVQLQPKQRWSCYWYLMSWAARHFNWARMLSDLCIGIAPWSWSFFYKIGKPRGKGKLTLFKDMVA